jgi:hypothetical protein
VLLDVSLRCLVSVPSGVNPVASRCVSVMCSLLVTSCFVMFRGFGMMLRGVPMVLGSLLVMFRCLLGHGFSLSISPVGFHRAVECADERERPIIRRFVCSRASVEALTVVSSTVSNDGARYATDATSGARYSTSPPTDACRPFVWIA